MSAPVQSLHDVCSVRIRRTVPPAPAFSEDVTNFFLHCVDCGRLDVTAAQHPMRLSLPSRPLSNGALSRAMREAEEGRHRNLNGFQMLNIAQAETRVRPVSIDLLPQYKLSMSRDQMPLGVSSSVSIISANTACRRHFPKFANNEVTMIKLPVCGRIGRGQRCGERSKERLIFSIRFNTSLFSRQNACNLRLNAIFPQSAKGVSLQKLCGT